MSLPRFIPLKTLLDTAKRAEIFGPEAVQEYFDTYRAGQSLSQGLTCEGALETYMANSLRTADGFADIKLASGETFGKKMAAAEAVKADEKEKSDDTDDKSPAAIVKKSIEKALSATDATKILLADYNAEIKIQHDIIQTNPFTYNSEAVASSLQSIKSKYEKGLVDQQPIEQANLDNLFKDNTFVDAFKTSLGLTSESEVTVVKDGMIAALSKQQADTKAAFTASIDEDSNSLYQRAEDERRRIAFLATMYESNIHNRNQIDNLSSEKNKRASPVGISFNMIDNQSYALFENIRVQDIPTYESITGQIMQQRTEKRKDAKTGEETAFQVFEMKLPNWGISTRGLYYQSRHDNILYDATNIASAVRACGHDSITMSVQHEGKKTGKKNQPDTEHAMKLGRKAYEAAQRAGFPPEKITIKVNGQTKTEAELFHDHPKKLDEIRARYASDTTIREKVRTGANILSETQALRKEIAARREKEKAAQPKADVSSPSMNP